MHSNVARRLYRLSALMVATTFPASLAAGESVSFRHEVMAVLSKAGCNAGVCHGNLNGKGGFKLSLRGQYPQRDWDVLSRELLGRRANAMRPDQSLILLKPTMQVAHEGGQRFRVDSPEYSILRDWIAAGLPADGDDAPRLERIEVTPAEATLVEPKDSVTLQVRAFFSDGASRDVTRLTVFETSDPIASVSPAGRIERQGWGEATVLVRYLHLQTPVRMAFVPARPDFAWTSPPEANFVDTHVFAKLRRLRINPSEVCDDQVFVRRVYLDLLGRIPTGQEAKAFVTDARDDKRSGLVDQLLDQPDFADFWALKWSDLLRNEEKVLDRKGVWNFHQWIRQALADNMPLDAFVRELIAARGSTYTNPPANYYRALRDPLTRAESTAQLFLGTRMQCAKCHNHPFDRWTQDDYYSWAALFAGVSYKVLENRRRDRNDKHEFDGEQVVWMDRRGRVKDPRTGDAASPRFLGAADADALTDTDRLEALADWMTDPDNPFFARAQVNRIWYHLLGRGIVDPIDDFRATNPPSHPALLDALADDFVTHRFDLRHLIRVITASRTYQLSAEPNTTNEQDQTNFSHAAVRRLPAETLLDAMSQVAGASLAFNGYPDGLRAVQLPGVQAIRLRDQRPTDAERFLKLFGKPVRLLACECERSEETTLNQAFQLVSGEMVNELLAQPKNRLSRLLAADVSASQIVDALYWEALSRPPKVAERARFVEYLSRADDRRAALEDLAWGLLNAKEFLLRR